MDLIELAWHDMIGVRKGKCLVGDIYNKQLELPHEDSINCKRGSFKMYLPRQYPSSLLRWDYLPPNRLLRYRQR